MMEPGKEFMFHGRDLPFYRYTTFEDMKRRKEFCDITIKFGNRSIAAHRIVLAAAIPYFRDVFGNHGTESDRLEISVEEIDPFSLESLVDFAYSCKMKITDDNVMNLLSAAFALRIAEVQDACCNFLVERFHPENAFPVRELAESFHSVILLENADRYICTNFDEVSKTQAFLNASLACIEHLIGRNDLMCSTEENVFDSVIKWVKVCPDERKCSLPQLLRKIRMSCVTPEYLTYVSKDEMIRTSMECRDIVDDARTYHFLPHHRENISSFETQSRAPPRKLVKYRGSLKPGIYAVSRSTTLTMQQFDSERGEWRTCKTVPFQSDFHNGTLSVWNGVLYYSDRNDLRSCVSVNGNWIHNGDFSNSKYNSAAAVLKDKLYACGGQEGEFITSKVKCYDLETNVLNSVKSMSVARNFPGVVSLGEYLYVLGGESCTYQYLDLVERYDPLKDDWTEVSPMLTGRVGMGCTTLDGKIYVCGGANSYIVGENGFVLESVEVYDPLRNNWNYISVMKTGRFLCSLVTYCGKLFALGGYDKNKEPVNTVEIYDPATDEWKSGQPFSDSMRFVQAVEVSPFA